MTRPFTVLIVDDEAHVRVFLKLLLKQLGVEVCGEAGDGDRAIELAQTCQPDVVFLDINMPVKGGLATLAELQRLAPELPVVVISSESAMKTVHEAVRLGAMDYILKHAPKDQTLARLREVFERIQDEADGGEEAPGSQA